MECKRHQGKASHPKQTKHVLYRKDLRFTPPPKKTWYTNCQWGDPSQFEADFLDLEMYISSEGVSRATSLDLMCMSSAEMTHTHKATS